MASPLLFYLLAGIAASFAGYSFISYLVAKDKNWKSLMRIIMVANIYCLTTIIVIINQNAVITSLGVIYFTGEVIVILFLVRLERRLIQNHQ
ncbi:MAG: hypothetical protein AAF693_01225 [Bacteroidota bacterium]